GFAWAAGSYFSGDQLSRFSATNPAASAPQQDKMDRAQLARSVQKMTGEIQALQADIGTLRAEQGQAAKASSNFNGLAARLDEIKSEPTAAIAAMTVKVDRLQREPEAKLSQVIDRLDRLERKLTISTAAAMSAAAGVSHKTAQATPDAARIQ